MFVLALRDNLLYDSRLLECVYILQVAIMCCMPLDFRFAEQRRDVVCRRNRSPQRTTIVTSLLI
jgi:hypothetical protein